MRKIASILACMALFLALAAPAFAQTATEDAYQGLAGSQQSPGGSGPTSTGGGGGTLPFTGLEIGLVALAGVALVGTGYAVSRASRFRESNA